jgi:hypothetical protein
MVLGPQVVEQALEGAYGFRERRALVRDKTGQVNQQRKVVVRHICGGQYMDKLKS